MSSASYDAANQVTQWGTASLSYDADGNLASDGTNTYSWDARNQLSGISGGSTASFGYDAFGRRTCATINGTSTGYLYDGANLVQELTGSTPSENEPTGLAVHETFSRTDAGGTSYYLTDALGSTLAPGNAAVTVVGEGPAEQQLFVDLGAPGYAAKACSTRACCRPRRRPAGCSSCRASG